MKQKGSSSTNEPLSRQGESLSSRNGFNGVQIARENSSQILSILPHSNQIENQKRNSSQEPMTTTASTSTLHKQKVDQIKAQIQTQPHHGGSKSLDQQSLKLISQNAFKDNNEPQLEKQFKIGAFSQAQGESQGITPSINFFQTKQQPHHIQSSSAMSVQQYLNANNYQGIALQHPNKLYHNDIQFVSRGQWTNKFQGVFSTKSLYPNEFQSSNSQQQYSNKINQQTSNFYPMNSYFSSLKSQQSDQEHEEKSLPSSLRTQHNSNSSNNNNNNNGRTKCDTIDSILIKKGSMTSEQGVTTCDLDNSINLRDDTLMTSKEDRHLMDISLNLRESLNQKTDSSIVQRVNLSTFSRDTSTLFPELNARDQTIVQKKRFEGGRKYSDIVNIKEIGFSNKSYIIDNLTKDMSVDFSKVEEISLVLDQEGEKDSESKERVDTQEHFKIGGKGQIQTTDILKDFQLQDEIKKLKDENQKLRIQSALQEEKHFKAQEDLKKELKKKEEIVNKLSTQIEELQAAFVSCQRLYSDLKSQVKRENKVLENKQFEIKIENKKQQDKRYKEGQNMNGEDYVSQYQGLEQEQKQLEQQLILRQIMEEFQIQTQQDILPKLRQVLDKDMIKLLECLTDMISSFSLKGSLEAQPSIKQIWKWLKNLFKEYVSLKSSQNQESKIIAEILKEIKIERKDQIITHFSKLVADSEQLNRISKYIKQYFQLPSNQTNSQIEASLSNLLKSLYPNNNKANSNMNINDGNSCNTILERDNVQRNQSNFKEQFKMNQKAQEYSAKEQIKDNNSVADNFNDTSKNLQQKTNFLF